MRKILFLIHDLGQGGAEKVLVNLVNNMNTSKFDITVISLFGGGVNEQFLRTDIRYIKVFKKIIPGNSKLMKLFTPQQLHRWFIKDTYDIEVSYLEGPAARIVSGCRSTNTELVTWIHSNHFSMKQLAAPFRTVNETVNCYSSFHKVICVSQFILENFCEWVSVKDRAEVLYNTVNSDFVIEHSKDQVSDITDDTRIKLIAVGTLKAVKGFDRLLRIMKRLMVENYPVHLYLLGSGSMGHELEKYASDNNLNEYVTFLGFQANPYKFVSKCDLFICCSHSEGFSTAVTESLIVGTPVCTVEVSGMKEMLGENNQYGIVTENNEEALYEGIKMLLDNPEMLDYYKKQAEIRGKTFSTENRVKAVEKMLLSL